MGVNILSLEPPMLSPTRGLEARAPGNFARFAHMPARTPAHPGFLHTLEGGNDGEGGNVSGILSHALSRE